MLAYQYNISACTLSLDITGRNMTFVVSVTCVADII